MFGSIWFYRKPALEKNEGVQTQAIMVIEFLYKILKKLMLLSPFFADFQK